MEKSAAFYCYKKSVPVTCAKRLIDSFLKKGCNYNFYKTNESL